MCVFETFLQLQINSISNEFMELPVFDGCTHSSGGEMSLLSLILTLPASKVSPGQVSQKRLFDRVGYLWGVMGAG